MDPFISGVAVSLFTAHALADRDGYGGVTVSLFTALAPADRDGYGVKNR